MAQICFNGQTRAGHRVHIFGVKLKVIFPFFLGKIHGDIGIFHQRLFIPAVLRKHADADAGRDAAFLPQQKHRLHDGGQDFMRQNFQLFDVLEIFNENNKLIAAQTADHIHMTKGLAEARGDFL